MQLILAFLSLLLMLSACSTDESSSPIQRADDRAELNIADESDSSVEEEQLVSLEMEFITNGESVTISPRDIPILQQYLLAQDHPEEAVAKMDLQKQESGSFAFFILQFSCHDSLCSHLLLHPSDRNISFLAADLAEFESFHPSPDESKILLHFTRPGEEEMDLSNIIAFDLSSWSSLLVASESEEMDRIRYTEPIIAVDWLDDASFSVTFPYPSEPDPAVYPESGLGEESEKETAVYYIQEQ